MTCPRCAELEHLLRELVKRVRLVELARSQTVEDFVPLAIRETQLSQALADSRSYLATAPERSPIREAVEIADFRGMR